ERSKSDCKQREGVDAIEDDELEKPSQKTGNGCRNQRQDGRRARIGRYCPKADEGSNEGKGGVCRRPARIHKEHPRQRNPDRCSNATLNSSSMGSIDQPTPMVWRTFVSPQGGKILSNLLISSEQLLECPGQGRGRISVALGADAPHDRRRRRCAFVVRKR